MTHYRYFRQTEHSKNAARKLNMQQQSATIVNAIAGTGCTSTTITTTTSTNSLNNSKQFSSAEQRIVTYKLNTYLIVGIHKNLNLNSDFIIHI